MTPVTIARRGSADERSTRPTPRRVRHDARMADLPWNRRARRPGRELRRAAHASGGVARRAVPLRGRIAVSSRPPPASSRAAATPPSSSCPAKPCSRSRASDRPACLRMQWIGARRDAPIVAEQPLAGRVHVFHGADPKQWRTDIPTFGRLRYDDLYPGIDVAYYGNAGQRRARSARRAGRRRRAGATRDRTAPTRSRSRRAAISRSPSRVAACCCTRRSRIRSATACGTGREPLAARRRAGARRSRSATTTARARSSSIPC